jgi:hypothetical protein
VKSRVLYFLFLLLMVISILAYLLRGVVQEWIIIPMARFLWLVRGYYGAFPQAAYWIIALGVAIIISIFSFHLPDWETGKKSRRGKPVQGEVKEMAFWIQRSKSGLFPKWHVAHILAELMLNIIDRQETNQTHLRGLEEMDRLPPREVEEYLNAALTMSYSNYPKPRRFGRQPATPFDQDLEPVISFLESLMENENDQPS